jgi:cytochrome P450
MAAPARVSAADTARLTAELALPALATGLIRRRPRAMAVAQHLQTDRRAVRLLNRLRLRYGTGPLLVTLPGRTVALVLGRDDVTRVLSEQSADFAPAAAGKRSALNHFQPHAVLATRGPLRPRRREFNELALDSHRSVHHLAEPVLAKVDDEVNVLLGSVERARHLDWATFNRTWWRLVRRVVLGDAAREDHTVTDQLAALRADANWAFLHPGRRRLRNRFLRGLDRYVHTPEPDSLAAVAAAVPADDELDPAGQLPHWLFAFDAAGMTVFRTLALLATHPEQAQRARGEARDDSDGGPRELPFLRACLREALRLWPTTPVILRESTTDTKWGEQTVPRGSSFAVYTPYFHRNRAALPWADAFDPEVWLDGRAQSDGTLLPFSAGPGECPGRNLMLLVSSSTIGALLRDHEYGLRDENLLRPDRPLPATVDHFRLDLLVRPAQ